MTGCEAAVTAMIGTGTGCEGAVVVIASAGAWCETAVTTIPEKFRVVKQLS